MLRRSPRFPGETIQPYPEERMGTALVKRDEAAWGDRRFPKPVPLNERLERASGCVQSTFIGFGLCGLCGGLIDPRRLDEIPWTPFCAGCASEGDPDTE